MTNELPIKATFKSGGGYDAPWLTIDAADPGDLDFKLDAILNGEVLTKVISVAELFKAANTAAPLVAPAPVQQAAAPAPAPWSQPQQQAPAPVQQQGSRLHPEGKTCGCGNVLNFKEVTRRSDGKTFQFWECPARQGKNDTQHVSEFAN